MQVSAKKLDGKAAGKVELDDAIFGIAEIRGDILQRVVRWQLAKRQAGTHKTQSRSEVSVTTKKFGNQKGGGGARHGARNAPIFVGGGVAHGPRVRSHEHKLPKRLRKLGLAHALSAKAKSGNLIILDEAKTAEPSWQHWHLPHRPHLDCEPHQWLSWLQNVGESGYWQRNCDIIC